MGDLMNAMMLSVILALLVKFGSEVENFDRCRGWEKNGVKVGIL